MMFWKLAWRNVQRNRRRSVITISAISIGLAALTFLWAFIDGMNQQMVENTTRYLASDIQIHLGGYHADPTLDLTIENSDALLERVGRDAHVAAATLRLEAKALASQADKSRGVMVIGVTPDTEVNVTKISRALVQGASLANDASGVLIGEQLAESLGVTVGRELVLVGQAYDGSIASGRFPVRGIFRTKIDELDGFVVLMPLPMVRELFVAPGGATAIAVRLKDRAQLEPARAMLGATLGSRYEVVGWPTLLPMVSVSVRYHEVTGSVVLAIFFIVVAAGVANPVLMAVLERTREFGIMLGIGTSPFRLLRLVVYEAILLGLFGLLFGNVIGLAIAGYFSRRGIDLTAFESGLRAMPGLTGIIYPVVRLDRSLSVSAIVFVTACLAALYPAIKAARLTPVSAIRGTLAGAVVFLRGRAVSKRWPVFLLIAARSILRNPRRTAITVSGTAFAIAAFIFLFGYYDGFGEQIIDTSTRYLTGHIQMEQPGFRKDYAPELAMDVPDALLARLAGVPNVEAVAPRVQAQALASSAAKSEGIMLIGIDPTRERRVTFIDRVIVEGVPLAGNSDRDIVIGRKLAQKLSVRLGERVVVMAQARDGELATSAYRIRGIFATESSAYDGTMAFVTLPAAQSFLALGTRVSTVNIRLRDRADLPGTVSALRAATGSPALSFASWTELLPQIDEMVRVIRVFRTIVLAIIFVIVGLAVMNTVFMAVAERTREFGVMMALGTSPAAIVRLVLYETAILMVLAFALGYGAGVALVDYFGTRGIDLSSFFRDYSAIPGLTGVSYPLLVLANIVAPGILLFVASVLVSLYPATHAAKLDPTYAIRHG